MTATLSTAPEAEQPELDPLRLLPITANLLPPEITDARRTRKVRRVAAAIVAGALVLTAVWYFVAKQQTSHAQSSLDQAEQQSVSLTHKEASYANLVKVQADAAAINTKLSALMANDLQWWQLLPALNAAAPAGVTLTSVSGTLATAGAASATPVPGTTGPAAVGSLTISGTAPDKNSIAAFLDALSLVKGLSNPYTSGAQSGTGSTLTFSMHADINSTALGGRFVTASPTPSATRSH